MHKKKYNKKGFSLLEVILALFVFSVGTIGMLALISNSISNSNEAKTVISASQLAQEGIELVRNKRDNNSITTPDNVFNGLGANTCNVDAANGLTCPSASFGLNYDIVSGVYSFVHTGAAATKFSRKIVIEVEGLGAERKTRSLVWWGTVEPSDDGTDCLNINKCIYVESILTNWGEE